MPIIPDVQTKYHYKFKVDSLNCSADLSFNDRLIIIIECDGIRGNYQFNDGVLGHKSVRDSEYKEILVTDEMIATCYYCTHELRYYMEQRKVPAESKQAALIDFMLTHLPL